MSDGSGSGNPFADDVELRRRNRAVVEEYLRVTEGPARLQRHRLYAEDARGGLWTTDTGQPAAVRGREKLADMAAWSLECFPDWKWTNVKIFETQDPNHFWVECDGEGRILFPDYPPGIYRNHFLHSFKLRDGEITELREFMNPCEQMRALGIEVPLVTRGGIPE
ncbi:PhzA/PhzB family protein [Lentzea sp. NEAU-D7]|uniref:PhzA/PhzB family protein n=1 Tax=Lentzea sp. NEAU-D7 TaxID=2994667 RepID=UPI00224A64C1|nr:PhzA/PhzB family protein [Lentzea sp. NEAU-D7]MCX2954711.1 PhzA/PhzB family protein [Lentzea sp. NEAU-D7]